MNPSPAAYDVLIIGGGPAGACAAAFARQAGYRTLVLEKEPFPRFRIGESLLPQGNAIFREIGVWPRLEAAGFIVKHGALFQAGDGSGEREVLFSRGLIPGLERTFQVERARFDALLLDHARDLGAEVRHGATATTVEATPDGVAVGYRDAAGAHTVRARWLLDASGRDRQFSLPLKEQLDPPRLARRVAIYTHMVGAHREAGIREGHTVIVRLPDGWCWLIPIDATRTSVGLVTTVAAMRSAGGDPQQVFAQEVRRSPRLQALLAGAEPVMEFRVTADYSYFRRDLAQERVLLLGDAAGFFDPIFSSGVYLATYSAREAVRLVRAADAAQRGLAPRECQRYTRTLKAHARVFERLIHAFYDNASFAVFMCSKAPLGLDRGVNAVVAGHSRLTWPLWWRLQLFLLICRLQRRLPVVPRLAWSTPA